MLLLKALFSCIMIVILLFGLINTEIVVFAFTLIYLKVI